LSQGRGGGQCDYPLHQKTRQRTEGDGTGSEEGRGATGTASERARMNKEECAKKNEQKRMNKEVACMKNKQRATYYLCASL
jgi:hypothetical protein